jgi:hypothetical protein
VVGFDPPQTRLEGFAVYWNALGCKSTTMKEDVIGIFANLLDLSAAEVLALERHDRMKSILKTLKSLPLGSLLLTLLASLV